MNDSNHRTMWPTAMMLLFCAAPLMAKTQQEAVTLELKIHSVHEIRLVPNADSYLYMIDFDDQTHVALSPMAFSTFLVDHVHESTWIEKVCNISSTWGLLWVGLGLVGQLLFTGRMIVQWLTSERRKRSVIPVSFWWMSLVGGAMLLTYFIWRRDVVGVLGQSIGVIVYSRNLVLIHRRARALRGTPLPRKSGNESFESSERSTTSAA